MPKRHWQRGAGHGTIGARVSKTQHAEAANKFAVVMERESATFTLAGAGFGWHRPHQRLFE